MNLLVVSHPCVTPVNQTFFADVQALTKWNLSLVVPAYWRTEYNRKAIRPLFRDGLVARVEQIPVFPSGNIPLHFYSSFLMGLLQRTKPDVIYIHNEPYALSTAQFYLANRLTNRRPIGFYTAQNIKKKYPMPFSVLERWVFTNSSFSFPVTDGALAVARSKGYSKPATLMPLAIDRSIYRPRREWAAAKRSEIGIAPDETVVGFIGRLVEEKGIETLIEALSLVSGHRYRCLIVGSGPYEAALRQMIRERHLEDKFVFVGFVKHEDAPLWLSTFDICVLPSKTTSRWKEQFGRVILESLACGTPVVGSDSGEIPTLLARTGSQKSVFPEGNSRELADRLLDLSENPHQRARLVAEGQRVIRAEYDQLALATRFAQTIESASSKT